MSATYTKRHGFLQVHVEEWPSQDAIEGIPAGNVRLYGDTCDKAPGNGWCFGSELADICGLYWDAETSTNGDGNTFFSSQVSFCDLNCGPPEQTEDKFYFIVADHPEYYAVFIHDYEDLPLLRSPNFTGADTLVDLYDFVLFQTYFLESGDLCQDLDGNGFVNSADFVIFVSHFLHGC